jgi:hypothetical protein
MNNTMSKGFKSTSQLSSYQNQFNNIYGVVDEINQGKMSETYLKQMVSEESNS